MFTPLEQCWLFCFLEKSYTSNFGKNDKWGKSSVKYWASLFSLQIKWKIVFLLFPSLLLMYPWYIEKEGVCAAPGRKFLRTWKEVSVYAQTVTSEYYSKFTDQLSAWRCDRERDKSLFSVWYFYLFKLIFLLIY